MMTADRDRGQSQPRDRVAAQDPAEQYLRALDRALADAPAGAREAALDDVRAHIADATAEGRPLDATLARLGPVDAVARQYRDELGLPTEPTELTEPTGSTGSNGADQRAAAVMHWANVLLGAVTGVFVAFLLPMFASSSETSEAWSGSATESGSGSGSSDLGTITETTTQTLIQQAGPGAAVLALIPALLAILPLVLPRAARLPVAIGNAVVVTLLCFVAGFTIGMFYVPLAVTMWATVVVAARPARRGAPGRAALGLRLLGSLFVAAPGLLILAGTLTGTVVLDWASLAVAVLCLGLAVLFALAVRWAYLVMAAVGAFVLVMTVLDPGFLMLATWWIGGVYLAIGLAAFVSPPRTGRAPVADAG
ncbi:MAG: hypothetical protein J0H64_01765 [Actinobacteria bacterium]|nr:hypothetical protein [Actinomycetota bacterium]